MVERFALHYDPVEKEPFVHPAPEGAYVRHADIAQLERDLAEARAELARIQAQAVALFWAVPAEALVGDVRALKAKAETLLAAEAERGRLAADLRKPFLGVFLDGRNEHGSHAIQLPQTSISGELERDAIELLTDQSSGAAEDIIKAAEAAGYEIGMCVAVTWKLERYRHDNGEIETLINEPELSEPLTIAFYGSADEQRRASLQTGEKGE